MLGLPGSRLSLVVVVVGVLFIASWTLSSCEEQKLDFQKNIIKLCRNQTNVLKGNKIYRKETLS